MLDFRSLWKNASWTSGSLIVTTALLLLETIVVARVLGATGLGLFVLIRAYPEAIQQVLDCRTRETMVKYLGEFVALDDRDRASAVVRLVWLVDAAAGLIATTLVLGTASLAARYIVHDASTAGLIALYSLSQFFGTLDSASGSVLRVFDRFRLASMMGAWQSVGRFVGIGVVLLLGGGIAGLVGVLVAVEVVYTVSATFITLRVLRRRIDFRVRGGMSVLETRRSEILKFLLHTNIAGTLKMSSDKLVTLIVGGVGGAGTAAIYKVASQAGSALMLFSDPFYSVIYPSLSQMVAREEWDGIFAGLRKLQRITLSVAIPGAFLASVAMTFLIPMVYGGEFRPAVLPGIVILWGMLPNVAFFWLRPLLLSLHEAGRLVNYRAIASSLQLVATLALVRPAGAVGAAFSLLIMQWLYAVLEMRLVGIRRRELLAEVAR